MTPAFQTVAQIAAGSLAAIRVLERHGIDYCEEGSLPIDQVCRDRNLDMCSFFDELAAATAEPPEERDWSAAPLRELMAYLVQEDHAFVRSELALLEGRLQRVVKDYGAAHPALLKMPAVFQSLSTELEAHLQGEERQLFPAIERYLLAMENGEPLKGSPLAAFGGPLHLMEQEHESAGAALRLLNEFCRNYDAPRERCLRYRALIDGLEALEDRLARHMYLEDTILYPRAAALRPSRMWQEAPVTR